MLYTLSLLKDKAIIINIINVSDTITENREDTIVNIIMNSASEIVPEKIETYFRLARKLDKNKHIELLAQWRTILTENSLLRSSVNGKMKNVEEDYFDKDILKFTDKQYKKAARVAINVIVNSEPRITDDLVFYRMKKLVQSEKLGFKGNFGIIPEMEICLTEKGFNYLGSFEKAIDFWKARQRKRRLEKIIGRLNLNLKPM
jgi:hypothetical protein